MNSIFHRSAALVAALVVALSALVMVTAPAQAATDPAKPGYAKVTEPEAYLFRHLSGRNTKVLHVETERTSTEGFWFAAPTSMVDRGFYWHFQPWGMWCSSPTQVVEWNGWLNSHRCAVDFDLADPTYGANTLACREVTGQPWKAGKTGVSGVCTDTRLSVNTVPSVESPKAHVCAPWERTCKERYTWEKNTPNSFWLPGPDACTGLPVDFAARMEDPSRYVTKQAVPDCGGADLPPNCPADSTHQGCTGVAPTWPTPAELDARDGDSDDDAGGEAGAFTASASAEAVVYDGFAREKATVAQSHRYLVHQVTKKAQRKWKGRTFRAKKTVKVHKQVTHRVTRTAEVSDGYGYASVSVSCSAASQDEAEACAQQKAQEKADTLAFERAVSDAASRAAVQARAAAAGAPRPSTVVKATAKEKRQAAKKAKRLAVKAVAAKVKKAQKRGR